MAETSPRLAPALPSRSSSAPSTTGPTRNTASPAVLGSVSASPSPPLGALSCASAFTAGPAAAVPIPHSPIHSCSAPTSSALCAACSPNAHIARLVTTTALSPTRSAIHPPAGADAIPNSAVMEKSSPTCAGVASRALVANHGMHVSFATKPRAFAAAAKVMTRWRSSLIRTRQSLAALIASSSRSNASSSSALMSTLIWAHRSSFSAAALISGSSEYPAVHASAAPEMR